MAQRKKWVLEISLEPLHHGAPELLKFLHARANTFLCGLGQFGLNILLLASAKIPMYTLS